MARSQCNFEPTPIILRDRELKGQMNQKIEIFSFVALPSPNTKNKHPKRFFFPSLYRKIKDKNPSISEDFTKTFLKWPHDGLDTT